MLEFTKWVNADLLKGFYRPASGAKARLAWISGLVTGVGKYKRFWPVQDPSMENSDMGCLEFHGLWPPVWRWLARQDSGTAGGAPNCWENTPISLAGSYSIFFFHHGEQCFLIYIQTQLPFWQILTGFSAGRRKTGEFIFQPILRFFLKCLESFHVKQLWQIGNSFKHWQIVNGDCVFQQFFLINTGMVKCPDQLWKSPWIPGHVKTVNHRFFNIRNFKSMTTPSPGGYSNHFPGTNLYKLIVHIEHLFWWLEFVCPGKHSIGDLLGQAMIVQSRPVGNGRPLTQIVGNDKLVIEVGPAIFPFFELNQKFVMGQVDQNVGKIFIKNARPVLNFRKCKNIDFFIFKEYQKISLFAGDVFF
jgi:hypothetical protein